MSSCGAIELRKIRGSRSIWCAMSQKPFDSKRQYIGNKLTDLWRNVWLTCASAAHDCVLTYFLNFCWSEGSRLDKVRQGNDRCAATAHIIPKYATWLYTRTNSYARSDQKTFKTSYWLEQWGMHGWYGYGQTKNTKKKIRKQTLKNNFNMIQLCVSCCYWSVTMATRILCLHAQSTRVCFDVSKCVFVLWFDAQGQYG